MNFLNIDEIEFIEKRLLTDMKEQYANPEKLWVSISHIDIDYSSGDPFTTFTIDFGATNNEDKKSDWHRTTTIIYINDSIDFIAGQFAQRILDEDE